MLFVDFVRPLRFPFDVINEAILWAVAHSSFVTDASQRYSQWEERFEKALAPLA